MGIPTHNVLTSVIFKYFTNIGVSCRDLKRYLYRLINGRSNAIDKLISKLHREKEFKADNKWREFLFEWRELTAKLKDVK